MGTIFLQHAHYMWCVARFGTICTIQDTFKTPMTSVTKHYISQYLRALFNFSYVGSSDYWCQYYFSYFIILDVSIILVDNVLQVYWYGWYLKVWLKIDSKTVFLIQKCTTCNVTGEIMGNCADVSKFRIRTE